MAGRQFRQSDSSKPRLEMQCDELLIAPDGLAPHGDSNGARITYDPRRLQGVTLYREEDRAFAVGDRVQLTAPHRERHLANRELGTIEQMQAKGELHLRLDSDRTVALNLREHPHLDYGDAGPRHT